MTDPSPAVAALGRLVDAKSGGVRRAGQAGMTAAVERAIGTRRHLLVEAGTGTGKSLAYLVPALLSGSKALVATATKTLQDQLAGAELPFLAEHLDREVTWAVVKGRQSYVCMAKLAERFAGSAPAPRLFEDGDDEAMSAIAEWAAEHHTGDRDDLPEAVPDHVWREVSVPGMECPGAERCPQGTVCFAEAALQRARSADVVITNHHLMGLHLSSGFRILPEHDCVVIDEAHKLETALSAAFGVDVSAGRLTAFANNAQRLVAPDPSRKRDPIAAVRDAAIVMDREFRSLPAARLDPSAGNVGTAILEGSRAVADAMRAIRKVDDDHPLAGPIARVTHQGGHVCGDFNFGFDLPEGWVAWAEPERGVVRVAPIEVADALGGSLLVHQPAVLTSATLTVGGSFAPFARRLGFLEDPPDEDPLAGDVTDPLPRTYTGLRVEGSFDYAQQGLLYLAAGLPDPRADGYSGAVVEEIAALAGAAGGRALLLTTSYSMLERIAAGLVATPYRVLVQGELPKKRLIAEFAADETAALVATMGYWEGIDVPGRSLSLVVIDRIPFPRPDDPLFEARRDAVAARGGSPFQQVDLPRAAMLLAQGAGRLIRSENDRGVVAILDSRITRMQYGRRLVASLPRLRKVTDREVTLRYLRRLAGYDHSPTGK